MNVHQKTPDQLSKVFLALAHPIRRDIISKLVKDDVSVSQLAEPFNMSLVAVTKHLKILQKAGLIKQTKSRQVRLSHLQAQPLEQAFSWIKDYRQFWDESFDKLEEAIKEHKKKEQLHESTNNK